MNYIVHNPDFVLFTIDNVLTNKEISALQQAMARSRSLPEKDSLVCVGNTHPSRKVLTDFLMPSVLIQAAAEGGGGGGGGGGGAGGGAGGGRREKDEEDKEKGKYIYISSSSSFEMKEKQEVRERRTIHRAAAEAAG